MPKGFKTFLNYIKMNCVQTARSCSESIGHTSEPNLTMDIPSTVRHANHI